MLDQPDNINAQSTVSYGLAVMAAKLQRRTMNEAQYQPNFESNPHSAREAIDEESKAPVDPRPGLISSIEEYKSRG